MYVHVYDSMCVLQGCAQSPTRVIWVWVLPCWCWREGNSADEHRDDSHRCIRYDHIINSEQLYRVIGMIPVSCLPSSLIIVRADWSILEYLLCSPRLDASFDTEPRVDADTGVVCWMFKTLSFRVLITSSGWTNKTEEPATPPQSALRGRGRGLVSGMFLRVWRWTNQHDSQIYHYLLQFVPRRMSEKQSSQRLE